MSKSKCPTSEPLTGCVIGAWSLGLGHWTFRRSPLFLARYTHDMLKRIGELIRWVRSHKRKSVGGTLGTIVFAYAIVFLLVSCSTSSTTEHITTHDGRELAYNLDPGGKDNGPRLILVHGAPANADAWNKLIAEGDRFHVHEIVSIDRPGYGNSTRKDELTLAGQAAALEPLLIEVNGHKPILVGHSYGGPAILRAAVDYPDRVGGIVLVAGACDAYMNDSQGFRRLLNFIRIVVPESWERSNRELLALTDENRAMEPLLNRVTCPVVIVHGTWDAVCPYESTVAYLQDRLVNASEVRVAGIDRAGHNLHLSHRDEIIEAVNGLVQRPLDTSTSSEP